ncbi:MAG: hypothetical protein ABIH34_04120, partial [Nanoarchaeota archaeon]
YVKDNQGRKEVHINDRSKLIVNPQGETVSRPTVKRKSIKELSDNEGDAEIMGTIVQVFDPTFFEVCPTCGKRTKPENGKYSCGQHGEVTPDYNYVTNLLLDDGSDNLRVVFFGRQTEQLFKKQKSDLLGMREQPANLEQLKNDLLGSIIKVEGRVMKNQMFERLEMRANSVDMNINPDEEIKRLEAEQNSGQG